VVDVVRKQLRKTGEGRRGLQAETGEVVKLWAGAVEVLLAALLAGVHEVTEILELASVGGPVADGLELVDSKGFREHVVGPGKELKALCLNGKLAHVAVVNFLGLSEQSDVLGEGERKWSNEEGADRDTEKAGNFLTGVCRGMEVLLDMGEHLLEGLAKPLLDLDEGGDLGCGDLLLLLQLLLQYEVEKDGGETALNHSEVVVPGGRDLLIRGDHGVGNDKHRTLGKIHVVHSQRVEVHQLGLTPLSHH